MKRRSIKTITVAIILALSLTTGGLAMAAENTPPVFTTQPQSQSINVGQDVTFTVAVSGTPDPSLQWQASVNGGSTWSNIAGQTGTTLRLNNVSINQNGNQYRSVATNEEAVVYSNAVTLIVNGITNAQIPAITNQPGSSTVTVNSNVTLSVAAEITDGGNLSYQWFRNTANSNSGGTMIQGATARTFTPPTANEGTAYYYVVVTNTNNNVSGTRVATITSNTARIVVNPVVNAAIPVIIGQPTGEEVVLNGNAMLIVTAETADNGTLSYQWFRNSTNSNTGGTPVSGAIGATFAPDTSTIGTTYYYVVVTNTNNNVNGTRTSTITGNAVPVSVITTPDAPLYLDVSIEGNRVVLSWEAPQDNGGSQITGYQVSDSVVTIWIEANGEYRHAFEGLNYDREYTFKVRAVNNAGTSEVAGITATTSEKELVNVSAINLRDDSISLLVGEYVSLNFTVSPEDADDTSVRWTSSNPSVAVVNARGTVTGITPGTTVITVTTNDGGLTDSIIVTVESVGNSNMLLLISLGALAPVGTGTGLYFWRRKRKSR